MNIVQEQGVSVRKFEVDRKLGHQRRAVCGVPAWLLSLSGSLRTLRSSAPSAEPLRPRFSPIIFHRSILGDGPDPGLALWPRTASWFPAARSPEVLAVGARCHPVEQLFLDDLQQQLESESSDHLNMYFVAHSVCRDSFCRSSTEPRFLNHESSRSRA